VTTARDWLGLARVVARGGWCWLTLGVLATICLPSPVDAVTSAMFALPFSAWLHEAGHVIAYWTVSPATEPVQIRSHFGLATSASVPEPGRASVWVALSGPLLPTLAGLVMCLLALETATPVLWGWGGALLLHLTGLLPGCSDGNRIWGLHES
jgi:Zn-dependent protease